MPQSGRTSKKNSAKEKGAKEKGAAGAKGGAKENAAKSRAKPNAKTAAKTVARASGKDRVAGAMSDDDARAALESSDKLYYRIGEVSELTAVKAHVLRYWETEFRWMAPPKSRSKQRLYRKRDIEFVWLLKRLLWDERYTIAGARQRIRELGVDDALKLLDQPIGQTLGAPSDAATGNVDLTAIKAAIGQIKSELLGVRESLTVSI